MGLGSPFSEPYYLGAGVADLTTTDTDVAFAGRPYMIDWTAEVPLQHVSIPITRQQQDTSDSPGEQSINPEGLWRRFAESWHLGAGQDRFDRKNSSPYRFRASQGVNVWDRWQLSLLPDTSSIYASAEATQRLAVAGGRLYHSAGQSLFFRTTLAGADTTVTGGPAATIQSIATNGYRVWTAHGASGIYMTDRTISTMASHITGTVALLAYVKNRVMAANGPSIYDVTSLAVGAGGALPAALFTHGNTDWNWVGFADSQEFIFAAGYSGDKSLIYSIGITSDGTALGAPVVAGTLPDGETITGVYGYLGRFLVLGSNKGIRLALVGEGGGLTIGALIETSSPVKVFEGQGRFIWYGLTAFTGTNSGLGRLSTGEFSDLDNFVPAYASDLMASGTSNEVMGIVTFENRRVFVISGVGVYAEHATDLVASGYIETGTINYGMTENKTALFLDTKIEGPSGTDASITFALATDGGAYASVGTQTLTSMDTMSLDETIGSDFEIRLTFTRDAGTASEGLTLLSWLLRVQPSPLVTNLIYATILLAPDITTLNDTPLDYNTESELELIEGYSRSKEVTTFQRKGRSYSVILEDYQMDFKKIVDDHNGMTGFNASCLLKLKRV